MRIYPPMPLFEELVTELGYFKFRERFFDDEGDVVEDAPQQLKDEIALLRDPDWDPFPNGIPKDYSIWGDRPRTIHDGDGLPAH